MLIVLTIIGPVFGLVAAGLFAVRLRAYPASGVPGLIAYVNLIGTPCLLFRAMLDIDFAAAFQPGVIGAYYFAAVATFFAGIVIARKAFGSAPGHSVAVAFGALFSNTVLLGLPIIQRAYGEGAANVIYTIIGLHAPLLITLGTLVMEMSRRDGGSVLGAIGPTLLRAVTNPLLIGISIGLLGNLAGLVLPEVLDVLTAMVAAAVLPVALFGLGGALNEYRVRDNWGVALVMATARLVLHPALAWLIMVPLLGIDPSIARYGVLLAAMPAGINVYIFATSYGRAEDVAAGTILLSTLLGVITIPIWLYVLH